MIYVNPRYDGKEDKRRFGISTQMHITEAREIFTTLQNCEKFDAKSPDLLVKFSELYKLAGELRDFIDDYNERIAEEHLTWNT